MGLENNICHMTAFFMVSCLSGPRFLIGEPAADISLAVSCSSNLLPQLLPHASC